MPFETPNQLSHPDLNQETNRHIDYLFQRVKLLKLQLDQASDIREQTEIAEKIKNLLILIEKSKQEQRPIKEGEPDIFEKINLAQEIMERNGKEFFLGPRDLEQAFGFKLEAKDIPELPFSQEEIERHRQLGDILILNLDKTPDGTPLTIEEMAGRAMQNGGNVIERDAAGNPTKYLLYKDQFDENGNLKSASWLSNKTEIKKQTPKPGWQFVSPGILPDSTDKNYLAQTELLIENARSNFFDGNFPPEYREAEEEFNQKKAFIEELIKSYNYVQAVKDLSALKISQLLREPMQNTILRYLVSFKKGQQLFTDRKYSWSGSASTADNFLRFGDAGASGADVSKSGPGLSDGSLGVVSSRF